MRRSLAVLFGLCSDIHNDVITTIGTLLLNTTEFRSLMTFTLNKLRIEHFTFRLKR